MLNIILLRIAKTAILQAFDKNRDIDTQGLISKYPFLEKAGASFVTLKYEHQLRGCIGSIIAHRKLLDDIVRNAKSAAFNDPRFSSLKSEEFSHLTLEVSILSEPHFLEYEDFDDLVQKIRPNIDGLILKYGVYQGTFLPQVWEQLTQAKDFLEHLSIKAGANPSIYAKHPDIYTYQVDAIEEKFDAILPL